jgi:WD40 repeat protein
MTLLIDDIRPYWECNIPGCRECKFSNGGQFFAAVLGSTIQIYNTWSFNVVGSCKGSETKIKSISWSKDDSKIISCAVDGSVTTWNMNDFKKEKIIKSDDGVLTSPCFAPDYKFAYSLCPDGSIREIIQDQITKVAFKNGGFSSIVLANTCEMMFGTGTKGSVRALRYPIPESPSLENDCTDIVCHSANINRLKVSCDDQYLFTCGDDGLLWIFQIQHPLNHKKEREWAFSDEVGYLAFVEET